MKSLAQILREGSVFEDDSGDRYTVKGVIQGQIVVEKMDPLDPNQAMSRIDGLNENLLWLYPEDPLLGTLRTQLLALDSKVVTLCATCVAAGVVVDSPTTWNLACDSCVANHQTINQLKNVISE